jgi:hypothetical protein
MFHMLEFTVEFTTDLEVSRQHALSRLKIGKGTRLRAQVMPYVEEVTAGPVEVADLIFEDGTAARTVPFAYFFFVD